MTTKWTRVATAALATVLGAIAAEDKGVWVLNDLEAAKTQAATEKKDLLVDFSGSDWCGWCIKLDHEVFSKKEFQDAASKDFVLAVLDFPRKPENKAKIGEEKQKLNEKASKEYGIRGFPTVILMTADGKPYARTGYQAGGVEAYLKHLDELKQKKAQKGQLEEKARQPGLAASERAKLLDQIIGLTEPEMAFAAHKADMEEIVKLDANNEAGLKSKYQLALKEGEFQATMEADDAKKAAGILEGAIADLKPSGEKLQDLYFTLGGAYFELEQKDKVKECLDKALAAAPDSKVAPRIKATRDRLFPAEKM